MTFGKDCSNRLANALERRKFSNFTVQFLPLIWRKSLIFAADVFASDGTRNFIKCFHAAGTQLNQQIGGCTMRDGQSLLVKFTEKVHGGFHLLNQTWANNTPDEKRPEETSHVSSFWMVKTNALILARRKDSSELFQHIFQLLCVKEQAFVVLAIGGEIFSVPCSS